MPRPDANSNSPAVVLDSSALLAYLQDEPGYDRVLAALVDGAAISTVNLAEVYTKTVANEHLVEPIAARLRAMGLAFIPFTAQDAAVAAELTAVTRSLGLSLGDRACLATAIRLGLSVLTADRAWLRVQVGIGIELFRP